MARKLFVASFFLLLLLPATALLTATAQEASSPLVVMNLAAHPDDEDGSTLAYYRRAENAIAYSVIFTRGEGGQNEIGPELYQELGALRTVETERAARILGTQIFFLNFYDFGFSKHAEEAFARWGGRDKVTARLVYLVRKLKPDVMFTNHDTVTVGPYRQHGHHQAVGIAAYDAFELAADSSFHPEQLQEDGVDLWQVKRLFLRRWRDAGEHDVAVPVGNLSGEVGKSYGDLAMDALREHASQGMEMFAGRLRAPATRFALLRSSTQAPVDPNDLAGNLEENHLAQPDLTYQIDSGRAPSLSPQLLTLSDSIATPGQRIQLRWDVDLLPERRLRWTFSGAIDTTLYLSDNSPGISNLNISPDAPATLPKALRQYDRFQNHPPIVYAIYGAATNTLLGAGYLPLEIAPPLVVQPVAEVFRFRSGTNRVPYRFEVLDPSVKQVTLNVAVSRDEDRNVLYQNQKVYPVSAITSRLDTVQIPLPEKLEHGSYTITFTGVASPVSGIASTAQAQIPGRAFTVAVPEGLRVGLIESYDNTLSMALDEMEVRYVKLDSLGLAQGSFEGIHTIVIDIRAYAVRPDLRTHNDKLLDWVNNGGHLVVNYQKTFDWESDFAPYPLALSRARVTQEDAPVEVLLSDHVLFHQPNEIVPNDWTDWTQERGLYFPEVYDTRYQELLSVHDEGENPLRGGLLLSEYGKGTYLYTPLVWYRQLKMLHPGAYKMFANLISLPLAAR